MEDGWKEGEDRWKEKDGWKMDEKKEEVGWNEGRRWMERKKIEGKKMDRKKIEGRKKWIERRQTEKNEDGKKKEERR